MKTQLRPVDPVKAKEYFEDKITFTTGPIELERMLKEEEELAVIDENWSGDHLDFRAGILGQTTTGTIDVAEDQVRIEVQLPWLLTVLADKVRPFIERQGQLMLEKPGNRERGG